MKRVSRAIVLFILVHLFGYSIDLQAQSEGAGDGISKKVGVYVFPAKGQSAEQTNKDESDCYTWAVQQSGIDPLNPPKVEAQQVATGPDGAAVVGAAKGAAVGAAMGAIAGDAGKGAGIGAIGGALRGRRASRVGHAEAQAQANQAASDQQANNMEQFTKAYTACLQGKGYTVN